MAAVTGAALLVLLAIAALLGGGAFIVLEIVLHVKKRKPNGIRIGDCAFAAGPLEPDGWVMVHGEVWPACTADNGRVSSGSRVVVESACDCRLIVRASQLRSR